MAMSKHKVGKKSLTDDGEKNGNKKTGKKETKKDKKNEKETRQPTKPPRKRPVTLFWHCRVQGSNQSSPSGP